MGCDIHIQAEKFVGGKWEIVPGLRPFYDRSYAIFGFLANVRNYSASPFISEPRGLPADYVVDKDRVDCDLGDHSRSWLSVNELMVYDYNQQMEDRRVTVQTGPNSWDGGATANPGGGEKMTVEKFLGPNFFQDLARLFDSGADRIVFGFDS